MTGHFNYHKHALIRWKINFFKSLFLCIGQLLAWLCFILFSIHLIAQLSFNALYILIPCLILLFISRFYIANHLLRVCYPDAPSIKSFIHLIPAAFYRIITGAVWGLPFAAVMYRFYQYIFVLPATAFSADFTAIGAAVYNNSAVHIQLLIGTAIFFTAVFVTAFIFAYGWRRSFYYDLAQAKGASFIDSLRIASKMRRKSRSRRFINTFLHVLLMIPSIILPLLLPMLQLYPLLTGKAMNDIQLIYAYLSAGIVSNGTLILSGCLFLLLYLPILPFRKLHNIAAVVIRHE